MANFPKMRVSTTEDSPGKRWTFFERRIFESEREASEIT